MRLFFVFLAVVFITVQNYAACPGQCGIYSSTATTNIGWTSVASKADFETNSSPGSIAAWWHGLYPYQHLLSYQYYDGNGMPKNYRISVRSTGSIYSLNDSLRCVCANCEFPSVYEHDVHNYSGQYFSCSQNMPQVQSVKCFELGLENPLKPLTPGTPVTNGKWVHVTMTTYNPAGGATTDSVFKTVLSGGCSAITIDGDTVKKMNATDTTTSVDGVTFHFCRYNGQVLNGSCSDNGLDTGCGGQTPFSYSLYGDSIINTCKSGQSIDPPDSAEQRPDDTINNNSDTALTGGQYMEGINRLSSDLRKENALNREISQKHLNEAVSQTSLLNRIIEGIAAVNKNLREGFASVVDKLTGLGGASDSLSADGLDSAGNAFGGYGGLDTIDTGTFAYGDTGVLFQQFRSLYGGDTLDTTEVDTLAIQQKIDSVAGAFSVYMDDGDCGCENAWFDLNNVPYVNTLNLNVCSYNIDQITKPLLLLVAAFILFVFYRDFFIKVIFDSFK